MPTIRRTSKYRKTFDLPERLQSVEIAEGALGPWYANTLNAGRQRFLHYMSGQSLLSVIIPLRDRASAEQRLVVALRDLLRSLKVPDRWIEAELSLFGSVQYGRASDQSVLGSLRDQANLAKFRLHDGQLSVAEINRELAETPCGPMSYATPRAVAPKRLEATWTATWPSRISER